MQSYYMAGYYKYILLPNDKQVYATVFLFYFDKRKRVKKSVWPLRNFSAKDW